MTSVNQFWRRAKLPLAVSLASTLAGPAFGVSFNIGEIEGNFDSSLSVGASWSTAKPNKDLIGANNGGRGLSQTSDDGHLNFKRGETFSKIFKGIHDLELKYGDTGVFVRGKYGTTSNSRMKAVSSRTSATTIARKAPSLPAGRFSTPSFITTMRLPISRAACASVSR